MTIAPRGIINVVFGNSYKRTCFVDCRTTINERVFAKALLSTCVFGMFVGPTAVYRCLKITTDYVQRVFPQFPLVFPPLGGIVHEFRYLCSERIDCPSDNERKPDNRLRTFSNAFHGRIRTFTFFLSHPYALLARLVWRRTAANVREKRAVFRSNNTVRSLRIRNSFIFTYKWFPLG